MGLLSDLFDVDPETEKDIKNIVKVIGLIALLLGGVSATETILDLPFSDDKEE
ncbi:MAG: hypothetical protein IJY19_11485 [Ruminococcus sp.]|nr:hypothetical protein [Ruminococcus sp.]